MYKSWWSVLTKCGPLDKRMANQFSILALRTPWEYQFSSIQLLICIWLFATLRTTAGQASLPIISSWNAPKPMSIESVVPSNHLTLCRPLLLPPSIFLSIRVLSNESALHIRWPKYWSFSLTSVLPVNTQDWSPLRWTGWISWIHPANAKPSQWQGDGLCY